MNKKEKIDIKDKKVIKITSGSVIRTTNISNFIKNVEDYNIITFRSLFDCKNETSPYFKIISIIARELDKINFSPFRKRLNRVKYFLTSLILLLIAINITFKYCYELINSFSNHIGIELKPIYIHAFFFFIFLLVILGLIYTDIVETTPIFKHFISINKEPTFYCKKVDRFKKKEDTTIDKFILYSKKWFKKNKNYLIVIYYLNYEILDPLQENSIYKLLSELLQKHNNIKLIYLNDKFDSYNKDNDILCGQLNNIYTINNHYVDNFDILNILQKVEKYYPQDNIFYKEVGKKLYSFNPNEFELEVIYENIREIYDQFNLNGIINFNLAKRLEDEQSTIIKIKTDRIINDFFKKKNNWDKLESDYILQQVFFELLMYNYYFFNAPIQSELVVQYLLIYLFNNSSSNDRPTVRELRDDLINKQYSHTKKYIAEIHGFGKEMASNLKSVEEDTELKLFELKGEDIWIAQYIINNKEDFITKLNFVNLSEITDFVKFFLFLSDPKESVMFNFFNKAFDFLDQEDVFIFKLLISHELMSVASENDPTGHFYIQGSVMAQEAWLMYNERLEVKQLSVKFFNKFRFNFNEIDIKPYKTLYYVISDKINHAGFVRLTISDISGIVEIINKFKFTDKYDLHLKAFNAGYKELIEKYSYYISFYDNIHLKDNIYLQLLAEIEGDAIILLPHIENENFINEIPKINIEKYKQDIDRYADVRKKDLDYLFLLVLTLVHNNCYYSTKQSRLILLSKTNEKDIDFIKQLLSLMRKRLIELRNSKLNYKKNSYFELHNAKFHLMINLLGVIYPDIVDDYSFEPLDIQFQKKNFLINKFENIEDYYGITDTYFWFSWFEIRLKLPFLSEVRENITKILKYSQKLGYFHFNNGFMYMGIISNSVIPPVISYNLITNLLNRKINIPKFIKVRFLTSLQLICYNGDFANKEQLLQESMSILDDLNYNYSKYLYDYERIQFKLMKLSILSTIHGDRDIIEELLIDLKSNVNSFSRSDKGLFYLRYIEYLFESNQIEEIIEYNYVQLTRKYLKENKFYYLQFLRKNIDYFQQILSKDKFDNLRNQVNEKIKEHNQLVENYNNKIKGIDKSIISMYKDEKTKIETIKSEIDGLRKKINTFNDKEVLIEELEKEFNNYMQNYEEERMILSSENHPSKYLIAKTALSLAKRNHRIFTISNQKTIYYYEIAMDYYYELKEYILFLRIVLELKIYSYNNSLNNNKYIQIEQKIKDLTELYNSKGKIIFDKYIVSEIEELSNLIYDYYNNNLSKSRENYSFMVDVYKKIDKNVPGENWKFDNDTKGLRKLISEYLWSFEMQKGLNELCEQFDWILKYADEHIEQLTFDDIQTIKYNVFKILTDFTENNNAEAYFIYRVGDFERTIKKIEMQYRILVTEKLNTLHKV